MKLSIRLGVVLNLEVCATVTKLPILLHDVMLD
jgi:hypothetical protein